MAVECSLYAQVRIGTGVLTQRAKRHGSREARQGVPEGRVGRRGWGRRRWADAAGFLARFPSITRGGRIRLRFPPVSFIYA